MRNMRLIAVPVGIIGLAGLWMLHAGTTPPSIAASAPQMPARSRVEALGRIEPGSEVVELTAPGPDRLESLMVSRGDAVTPRAFEMSASGSPWLCRLLTPRRTSQVFAASSAPAEKAETPHALSHRVACNDSVRSIVALCRDASPTGRSPECATISPKHRPIRRLPRRQTAFISAQRVISPSSVRRGALVVVLEPNIGGGRCASC